MRPEKATYLRKALLGLDLIAKLSVEGDRRPLCLLKQNSSSGTQRGCHFSLAPHPHPQDLCTHTDTPAPLVPHRVPLLTCSDLCP